MRATAKCKVIQVSKHHTVQDGDVGEGGGRGRRHMFIQMNVRNRSLMVLPL